MWGAGGNLEMTPSWWRDRDILACDYLSIIIPSQVNLDLWDLWSVATMLSPAINIITNTLKTLQNLMEENRLIDLVLIQISALLVVNIMLHNTIF